MKALVGAFNQEKALVGAFSVIVQLHRLIVYSSNVDRLCPHCPHCSGLAIQTDERFLLKFNEMNSRIPILDGSCIAATSFIYPAQHMKEREQTNEIKSKSP